MAFRIPLLTFSVLTIAAVALTLACSRQEPATAEPTATITADPTPIVAAATGPLTEEEYASLMNDLLSGEKLVDSIDAMQASGDRSFIPALVEMIRFLAASPIAGRLAEAIDALSGQELKGDWVLAVEWLGKQTDLKPAPGFAEWKGRLFAHIDENFREFIDDGVKSQIRIEEIVWGGVAKDGIPALIDPTFVEASEALYLEDFERVFGVSINGDQRAYPFRIMDWHEMANDTVGEVDVALSYCTLCGAGILYHTEVNGTTYTFGSSGLLYRSNKLMFDHQTNTLWNSLTGEPAVGLLADSGIKLKVLPLTVTTWGQWRADHPDTTVLAIETGYERNYTPGVPYGSYFASTGTMFPVWQRSDRLATKDWVLALMIDGVFKAYPLDTLSRELVSNDTLNGVELVVVTNPDTGTARAYERGEHSFKPSAAHAAAGEAGPASKDLWGFPSAAAGDSPRDGIQIDGVVDETGEGWDVTDEALVNTGDPSQRLERLGGHMAYWFAWYAFHPDTQVYGQKQP